MRLQIFDLVSRISALRVSKVGRGFRASQRPKKSSLFRLKKLPSVAVAIRCIRILKAPSLNKKADAGSQGGIPPQKGLTFSASEKAEELYSDDTLQWYKGNAFILRNSEVLGWRSTLKRFLF